MVSVAVSVTCLIRPQAAFGLKDMIGSKAMKGMHVLLYQVVVLFNNSTLILVLGILPSE